MEMPIKPLFLYGTLQSPKLLALIVTGSEENAPIFESLAKAKLKGYQRRRIWRKSQPCLTKCEDDDTGSTVDGVLFYPSEARWLRILDDFEGEGEAHIRSDVQVSKTDGEREEVVDAMCYVWANNMDGVLDEEWRFEVFEREGGLEDYLAIFDGMEFLG